MVHVASGSDQRVWHERLATHLFTHVEHDTGDRVGGFALSEELRVAISQPNTDCVVYAAGETGATFIISAFTMGRWLKQIRSCESDGAITNNERTTAIFGGWGLAQSAKNGGAVAFLCACLSVHG